MGLSFHNKKSMVETIESLRFASSDPNPIPETESVGIVPQESRDDIGVQPSNDMEIVETRGCESTTVPQASSSKFNMSGSRNST